MPLKIAFLCGSLEPGKDGVGDYTREMARELTATGHACLLISLNERGPVDGNGRWGPGDKAAGGAADRSSSERSGQQPPALQPQVPAGGAPALQSKGEGKVLRLTGGMPMRVDRAREAIREFDADWLSLQFVPYAFHPKGMVSGLTRHLQTIVSGRKTHLMFHELWIGEAKGYGWKDRLIGALQKRGIRRLIRGMRPDVVHTSNAVYKELLRREGVTALELPLFGNIPISALEEGWRESVLDESFHAPREDIWLAGVFGTIHPQWSPAGWLDALCDFARANERRLVLVHFGHTPDAGRKVWEQMARDYGGKFRMLGQLSAERASHVLQQLDFGVATSPWALIGKSGSAAAMIDHGVPVLVIRNDWKLRRGPTPEPEEHPLLFRDWEKLPLQSCVPRQGPKPRVSEIAGRFIDDLTNSAGFRNDSKKACLLSEARC